MESKKIIVPLFYKEVVWVGEDGEGGTGIQDMT